MSLCRCVAIQTLVYGTVAVNSVLMLFFEQPRRWLQRQKDAFFTLSREEKQLVAAEESKHGEER